MKAAYLYHGQKGLVIEEAPEPVVGAGDVLVGVKACGVCGTDVHLSEGHIPISLDKVIPGHEIAGVVLKVGSAVSRVKVGDSVILFPQIFCDRCYACRDGHPELCVKPQIFGIDVNGGFAERVSVPERVVMSAPRQGSDAEKALFGESIGVTYHALFARGAISSRDSVLVVGIGGLGTNAIKLLKAQGCSQVIALDTSEPALDRAKKMGADHTINGATQDSKMILGELTRGEGVDVAVDFVGKAETVKSAYRSLKKGGRLVLVGVGQDKADFGPLVGMAVSGRVIIPSFGYSLESSKSLMAFTEKHHLSFADSVSEVFPLAKVATAIEKLRTGSGESVRLVVAPASKD